MLFGIKYSTNPQRMEILNYCLKEYGNAIYSIGGKCKLYFTNPIEAFKTSMDLNKNHEYLTYRVFVPNKEERSKISEDNIVHTKEEYENVLKQRLDEVYQSIRHQSIEKNSETEEQEM